MEHQSQQANEEAQQTSDSQTRPFQQIGNDFDFPQSNLSLQAQQTDMAEEDEPPLKADNNVISLMNDQKADPTLATLGKATELEDTEYVVHNQVLHRQTTDPMGEQRFQIVLPSNRCDEVIKLAYATPMAGHIGTVRTKYKIMKNFFWPGISSDVRKACQSCSRCQKTAKRTYSKAPMQVPAVHINRPFEKVAIDIVGPLPVTRKKNRYILTYIDLGTRYPDAVPLHITTVKVVAEKLLYIMSRLSVPLEILSDRGTNFMSKVMKEAFSFLGIQHSKTAPYRLQSSGAVEHFHHTLLQMIRKTVADHREWDDYLPYFLFACREAPCSSTNFLPFELLIGKHVHGPLGILSRQWVPAKSTYPTVIDWLI